MPSFIRRSGLAVALLSAFAVPACFDFNAYQEGASCPEGPAPTAVCIAPATDFRESVDELPFAASTISYAPCGDGDKCMSVAVDGGRQRELRSKAHGPLTGGCSALVTLAEKAEGAWSFVALVSADRRFEVAVRPGRVRFTGGSSPDEQDLADEASVDGLRVWSNGSQVVLEALAGDEVVATTCAEEGDALAEDYEVRFGVDASDDAEPASPDRTLFDAYGIAASG